MPGLYRLRCSALLAILVVATTPTKSQVAKTEVLVRECSANEYFDSSNLQCNSCPSPPNKPLETNGLSERVPNLGWLYTPFEAQSSYKVPAGCTCAAGWVKNSNDLYSSAPCEMPLATNLWWCDAFTCQNCAQSSSLDRLTCMECGASGSSLGIKFDNATKTCVCTDSTHVLREKVVSSGGVVSGYKYCEPCPSGTVLRKTYLESLKAAGSPADSIVEADSYTCQQCPHPKMTIYQGKCVCANPTDNNPTWTQVGEEGVGNGITCILTAETAVANKQDANQVEYSFVVQYDPTGSNGQSRRQLSSKVDNEQSLRQLQTLGSQLSNGYTSYLVKNSIIFAHYFQIAGPRCRYLRDTKDVEACQTLANLCVIQLYDDNSPACELLANIQTNRPTWTQVSWDWKQLTPWTLYDMNPQLVLSNLDIGMPFSFNMDTKPGTYDFVQFVLARYSLNGTFLGFRNVTSEFEYCQPTKNQIPRWKRFGYGQHRAYSCNLFNIMQYFPEPEFYDLYLVDYTNQGALFPVPVRMKNLRKNSAYPNENQNPGEEANDVLSRRFYFYDQISSKSSASGDPAVIRYAKSMSLRIMIQDGQPDKIYPPLLEIMYEERLVSSFYAAGVDELGNPRPEATDVELTFTVEYTENYDGFWSTTSVFFGIALTSVGLLTMLRLYNWSRRNTRLPGDAPIDFSYILRGMSYLFSTFSNVFFWFLFIYSMYFFVFFKMQDNIQLLLPTNREEYGKTNDYYPFTATLQVCFFGQLARMVELVIVQTSCDIFFLDWEKPRGRVNSKRGDGTKSHFAPISVWRTIFMANEWNELQSRRKYTLELVLILVATVLIAGDYQYAATPTPNFKDLTPGTLNIVLRFFNTTIWFLIIAYGELLWKWAIQDRYITEPPTHSFVDLCTMAKVSVFVLDEEYHGYYLHCRSQHEYADGSILEISRQLRQEAEGLTTDRGLPGCPQRGQQTFEIYVTGEWKRQYNHIYRTMMQEELQNNNADTGALVMRLLGKKNTGKRTPEKLVKASRKLNAFLRSFVDQDTSDYKIQFREQNFVHRLLHTPPEMGMNSKESIFFPDTFYNYDKVLFYGETWNLILFNVLTLAAAELWTDDLILAIFVTYLFDRFFLAFRLASGNSNLSAKTLIDDRFLI